MQDKLRRSMQHSRSRREPDENYSKRQPKQQQQQLQVNASGHGGPASVQSYQDEEVADDPFALTYI